MVARISPMRSWTAKDMGGTLAGSYAKDRAGDDVPTMLHATQLAGMGARINALLAMGRMGFSQGIPSVDGYDSATDADPLWQLRIDDTADNGRRRVWSVLYLPRTTAPVVGGTAYAHRTGAAGHATPDMALGTDAVASTDESDLAVSQFIQERGSASDAIDTEGLSALQGARIIGLTVQDEPLDSLDGSLHSVVAQDKPKSGDDVISDRVEDLRAKLHHLRSECLPPVAWWSANVPTTGARPTATGWTGYYGNWGAAYRNIMDGTSTSRTATTPGVSVHCEHCGRGNPTLGNNNYVQTDWYFLAEVNSGTGNISVAGPNGSGSVSVTATTPTWVGPITVNMSSDVADDDATTARNKADIFARNVSGGTNYIWIYGWAAFTTYV